MYEPWTASLLAPESAASTSGYTLPSKSWAVEGGPCVTSRGKPTRRPSWWRGWATRPWIELLCGTISAPFMANLGAGSWISSLRASRVSHTLRLAEETSTTPATFGPYSAVCCASYDQRSSSWKTSPVSSEGPTPTWPGLLVTWPKTGGMRSGHLSPRLPLVPLTSASGRSCWPTATVADSRSSGNRRKGTTLTDAIKRWADSSHPGPVKPTPILAVNPCFVEFLLGLPPGWTWPMPLTASSPWATLWSHYRLLMRSALSGGD